MIPTPTLPSLLVGFSTTNFTRQREPTLLWNQLHSLSLKTLTWLERFSSTSESVLHTRIAGKWFRNELSHLGTFISDQKRSV
jgi:hypothetical protein